MDLVENDALELVAGLLVVIAALNWGTTTFLDYNILTQALALETGSQLYRALIGLITVSAFFTAYSTLYWSLIYEEM